MSKPIFTDNGVIDTNMELVQKVIGDMETNLKDLEKIQTDLLNAFQGEGAGGFGDAAKELGRRLVAYRTDITDLKGATTAAQQMIADADKNVARLFQGMM